MKSLYSSIILILTLTVGVAVAKTAPPADSLHSELHPTTALKTKKIKQRFNPIFGDEKESNQIISFISANLVLELDEDQLASLDGYVVVQFVVDTSGLITNPYIARSYNSWVDYIIMSAIKELPDWGVPSLKNGEPVERSHQVVFTFGSYVQTKRPLGLQNEAIAQNTQNKINEQRDAYFAEKREKNEQWNSFTDQNSVLEYNIKDGLRNEARTLQGDEVLRNSNSGSVNTPTITITEKD